jgi:hypothetical protein
MIALIWFVLAILASPFKSKSRLEAENAVLRHQLIVLRRKVRGRAHLTNNDRWFFVQMYRWFPSILEVATVKQAFACQYRLRCRCHESHPCKLSPLNRFAPPAHSWDGVSAS